MNLTRAQLIAKHPTHYHIDSLRQAQTVLGRYPAAVQKIQNEIEERPERLRASSPLLEPTVDPVKSTE